MYGKLIIALLLLAVLPGCPQNTVSQSNSMTLHNESAFVIDQFFVRTARDLGEGQNYIEDTLLPGESVTVRGLSDGLYRLTLRYEHGSPSNKHYVDEQLTFSGGRAYNWYFYRGTKARGVDR